MATATRIGMRNAWFQVHKWIGLLLAVLIIPISITGAALVWHDGVDELLNPQRVVEGKPALDPADYAEAARGAARPGERLAALRVPDEGAVVATLAQPGKPGKGRPVRTMLWLDPADGHVIDRANSNAGAVRVMHQLHGSLMVPGVGRQIVGWIGVAMLLSSISGLWLWWPSVGRWVKGLRWKRHRNLDSNLHHQFGFWIALPLFIASLTGVWISFPGVFSPQPAGAQRGPDRAARMRAQPLDVPAAALGSALSRAQAVSPGAPRNISWPTDVEREWTITLQGEGKPTQVKVNQATGTAERIDQRPDSGGLARTMRRIHDGDGMGFVWQVIVFLGGIIPAGLAITGIIMWWRSRGWRAQLADKQRRRRATT